MPDYADDMRTVSALFEAALQEDDEASQDAIGALHWRGTSEVLDKAVVLIHADAPTVRARGADILAQLGVPDRTFPSECFLAVLPMLADAAPSVVASAIFALAHIDRERAAPYVIAFARNDDRVVRHAVTFALGGVDTAEAIATLLALTTDGSALVRDWATFGLARLSDADTPQIRKALAARMTDDDQDVRYEAVIGLGRRRDGRAVEGLKAILQEEPDDLVACEAAALLGIASGGETATGDMLAVPSPRASAKQTMPDQRPET